jgi:hypothetical protein
VNNCLNGSLLLERMIMVCTLGIIGRPKKAGMMYAEGGVVIYLYIQCYSPCVKCILNGSWGARM